LDAYVAGIDPLYAIGSNISFGKIQSRADANQEFASIFVSQVLKQVFKSQTTMFGEEGTLGMFSDNLYNDILVAKMASEIAKNKSFGFDKLITGKK
jgi:Rod binding domain-containing protein